MFIIEEFKLMNTKVVRKRKRIKSHTVSAYLMNNYFVVFIYIFFLKGGDILQIQ